MFLLSPTHWQTSTQPAFFIRPKATGGLYPSRNLYPLHQSEINRMNGYKATKGQQLCHLVTWNYFFTMITWLASA